MVPGGRVSGLPRRYLLDEKIVKWPRQRAFSKFFSFTLLHGRHGAHAYTETSLARPLARSRHFCPPGNTVEWREEKVAVITRKAERIHGQAHARRSKILLPRGRWRLPSLGAERDTEIWVISRTRLDRETIPNDNDDDEDQDEDEDDDDDGNSEIECTPWKIRGWWHTLVALARDSRELNCQVNDQLLSLSLSLPFAFLLTPSTSFVFPCGLCGWFPRPGYAAVIRRMICTGPGKGRGFENGRCRGLIRRTLLAAVRGAVPRQMARHDSRKSRLRQARNSSLLLRFPVLVSLLVSHSFLSASLSSPGAVTSRKE